MRTSLWKQQLIPKTEHKLCKASNHVRKVNGKNAITLCLICFLSFPKKDGRWVRISCTLLKVLLNSSERLEKTHKIGPSRLFSSFWESKTAGWAWVVPGEGTEVFLVEGPPAWSFGRNVLLGPGSTMQPQPLSPRGHWGCFSKELFG